MKTTRQTYAFCRAFFLHFCLFLCLYRLSSLFYIRCSFCALFITTANDKRKYKKMKNENKEKKIFRRVYRFIAVAIFRDIHNLNEIHSFFFAFLCFILIYKDRCIIFPFSDVESDRIQKKISKLNSLLSAHFNNIVFVHRCRYRHRYSSLFRFFCFTFFFLGM